MDTNWEEICKAVFILAGSTGIGVLTPGILAALGFTSAGIVAGSIAEKLISYFGLGSLIAFLQSWGVSWFATGGFGSAGAAVGWMLSTVCNVTVTH